MVLRRIARTLVKAAVTGKQPARKPSKLVQTGLRAARQKAPAIKAAAIKAAAAGPMPRPRTPTGAVGAGLPILTPRKRYNAYVKQFTGASPMLWADWNARFGKKKKRTY